MLNDKRQALIVDPGEADPVLQFFHEKKDISLSGILITHKHGDHCHGVPKIVQQMPVPVFGPKHQTLDFVTFPMKENAQVKIEGFETLHVMEIPGHTMEHIAYYNKNTIFCGDTLFTGGCGRIFEGTPLQMFDSLQKICALPNDVLIYCGHEYTLANLEFALKVEPHNKDLLNRFYECQQLRKNYQPTVPASLQLEKMTNPFLRCEITTVAESVKHYYHRELTNVIEIFEFCRKWKNEFVSSFHL